MDIKDDACKLYVAVTVLSVNELFTQKSQGVMFYFYINKEICLLRSLLFSVNMYFWKTCKYYTLLEAVKLPHY